MKNRSRICEPASLRDGSADAPTRRALALGMLSLFGVHGLPSPAISAPEQQEEELLLDTLKIEETTLDSNPYAQRGAPYKARISGDPRRTEELARTPATISVLTQSQIQESGRSDLRAIVAAQPGITLGTGENGNAFGDRYIIRGQEARSDVFIDSLRDPGMSIRESFAVEQVEITKGPNSTFAGRGSSGGTINSITKRASTEYLFNRTDLGLGTDDYYRLTLDSNLPLGERAAFRANLLSANEAVPDRAPAERDRDGAALSALFEPTERLRLMADYYYLDASGSTDLGTYIEPNGGRPVEDLPVYLQDQDFLDSRVNIGTLRGEFELADNLKLVNAARYGQTDNGYVLTGARGATRNANDPEAPGAATVSLSTHQGWQEVDYFVDQLNLLFDTRLAGREHSIVIGTEYSDLDVRNGVYAVSNQGLSNCLIGGGAGSPGYCLFDGSGQLVDNPSSLLQRQILRGNFDSDYSVQTLSFHAIDSFQLSERWSASVGLRWDDTDYRNVLRAANGSQTVYDYSDELWNGNASVSYQFSDGGMLYLAYATASDINGGESDVGGSCGYGGLCGTPEQVVLSQPERVENIELGSKWDLLDNRLLFNAAIFQIRKDDVMESVGNAYSQLGTLNTGANRVRGVEFGLTGNINDRWSLQFAATFMDSEVTDAFNPAQIGKLLSNFADQQAHLQLRYQASDKLSIGSSVTYSSEMYAGQPDSAAGFSASTGDYSYRIPGYTTLDAFANYAFNDTLKLRLNVGNVFDQDYYLAAYRSGAFTYIGDARNARLTLSAEF